MTEVPCPYCSVLFSSQSALNRHIKSVCPVLKASIAMASLNLTERAGRTSERDDKPPSRRAVEAEKEEF